MKMEEKKGGVLVGKWVGIKGKLVKGAKMTKKIGKDDPRRVIHSMKVGLALTLATLLLSCKPLYSGFKETGIWAIITVVVVFEFTVGGTLSKSLNRGGATLVGAGLGVAAEYLASLGGEQAEIFILAFFVFIVATASSFTRFIPGVKRRYDYGMMIFVLTFTLVVVTGSRADDILVLGRERLATILIGASFPIIISISVCPVWAGRDLHHLIAANILNLVAPLILDDDDDDHEQDNPFLVATVLNSKPIEESLANFAWWEPPHGPFRFRHPWKQYLKIGMLTRECAAHIQTLGASINSKPKVKVASQLGREIEEACTRMSRESGKAMKEMASTITNMRPPSPALQTHIHNSKAAATDLKNILHNFSSSPKHDDIKEIMRLFLVSSTLMDIISSIDKISLSVTELSRKAAFRSSKATVEPCNDIPETKESIVVDIHVLTTQKSVEQATSSVSICISCNA